MAWITAQLHASLEILGLYCSRRGNNYERGTGWCDLGSRIEQFGLTVGIYDNHIILAVKRRRFLAISTHGRQAES